MDPEYNSYRGGEFQLLALKLSVAFECLYFFFGQGFSLFSCLQDLLIEGERRKALLALPVLLPISYPMSYPMSNLTMSGFPDVEVCHTPVPPGFDLFTSSFKKE